MSAVVDAEDLWSSDEDDDDVPVVRDDLHDFAGESGNFKPTISGPFHNNSGYLDPSTEMEGIGTVGKVVRVAGGRKMQTNPQLTEAKPSNQESSEGNEYSGNDSDLSPYKSKQARKNIVEINSVEEASFVISNLRKMRSTKNRLVNSSTATINNIDAFDRLVLSSNNELQNIASLGKRMDEKLSQPPLALSSSSSPGCYRSNNDNCNDHDSRSPSSVQREGIRNNEEDFKAALLQRVYNSPIKNDSPSGTKYSPDPIPFDVDSSDGVTVRNENTDRSQYTSTSSGAKYNYESSRAGIDDDEDEWSDDEEEKDAEKLRKYNLPPSPSKYDFYDHYDMYDNSNYGSDDEKNVHIENITTFRVETKKKNNDRNNLVKDKGPSVNKENTDIDEIELSYGDDDDDLGSELVFKASKPSKMPKPAQKLNDARAAAVMSSTLPPKTKSLAKSSKGLIGEMDSSTGRVHKPTMPINLLGTKGGVIRVRAPGRAKMSR